MTPEQEDAHWALMGKPLMRHWLVRLAELERYRKMADTAAAMRASILAADETALTVRTAQASSAMCNEAERIRRAAEEAWWAAIPDASHILQQPTSDTWTVDGIKYAPSDATTISAPETSGS